MVRQGRLGTLLVLVLTVGLVGACGDDGETQQDTQPQRGLAPGTWQVLEVARHDLMPLARDQEGK